MRTSPNRNRRAVVCNTTGAALSITVTGAALGITVTGAALGITVTGAADAGGPLVRHMWGGQPAGLLSGISGCCPVGCVIAAGVAPSVLPHCSRHHGALHPAGDDGVQVADEPFVVNPLRLQLRGQRQGELKRRG